MPKIDHLNIAYVNTAPTAGNRLSINLIQNVNYQRGLYFQYMEIMQGYVRDTTTNTLRTITGAQLSLLTGSGIIINTLPQSYTLDPNAILFNTALAGASTDSNLPWRVDFGDVYCPSGVTFGLSLDIYCAGIVATDRVDFRCRLGFEFEGERKVYQKQFDENDFDVDLI